MVYIIYIYKKKSKTKMIPIAPLVAFGKKKLGFRFLFFGFN